MDEIKLQKAEAFVHPTAMAKVRKSHPGDVSDDEWAFCAPYLTLLKEDAPQRDHSLHELYNGLRWFVRAGGSWRMLPNDLPPRGTRCNNRRSGGCGRAVLK